MSSLRPFYAHCDLRPLFFFPFTFLSLATSLTTFYFLLSWLWIWYATILYAPLNLEGVATGRCSWSAWAYCMYVAREVHKAGVRVVYGVYGAGLLPY